MISALLFLWAISNMKKIFFLLLVSLQAYGQNQPAPSAGNERLSIAAEMERSLKHETLDKWYPQSVDSFYGGFLSSFTYNFQPTLNQDKMIVTQSRHIWTNSKASMLYPDISYYKADAQQGFLFLKNKMWDKTYGGFYTLVDREGHIKNSGLGNKTAYGNAFAIYALSAYYEASGDTSALNLAKQTFWWLENHSHDKTYKGYFQHMQPDGTPIKRTNTTPSTSEFGYKDQNSSIHLLEAFTSLYAVWKDSLVRERLQEMLFLIRDKICSKKGSLVLFFQTDWTPVSFRDSSEASILKHRSLDHVSFGHDVETAFLILEASRALGLKNDKLTLSVAKRMLDHALRNGWDNKLGGFYDEGYYFRDKPGITIIKDSKNWWAQAEGLNTLSLMAGYFPKDTLHYFDKFKLLWKYTKTYLIDHRYGDWYEEGLDKEPQRRTALKGHIWKATYHQARSLMNCVKRLRGQDI